MPTRSLNLIILLLLLAGPLAGRAESHDRNRQSKSAEVQAMLQKMQHSGKMIPYPPTAVPPTVGSTNTLYRPPPPQTTSGISYAPPRKTSGLPGYIVFLGAALFLFKKADPA